MITMDIFKDDAFKARTMTAALDKMAYQPRYLSSLPGLITDVPVRTRQIMIEQRSNGARLIQTSAVGAPLPNRNREKANLRGFETVRIAEESTIWASEVEGMRAFGSETELETAQKEVALRQKLLNADLDLTHEYHLMQLVNQGKFVDADGTVLVDWYEQWGETADAEVDFDLDDATPEQREVYQKCVDMERAISRSLETLGITEVNIHANCSDGFYDALTKHPEVTKTFDNWQAAQQLRNEHGRPWQAFRYGNIWFHNYRGTADKRVAIPDGEAKFFPVGAGIFQRALAPHQNWEFINTMGRPLYAQMIYDMSGHNEWVKTELYRYPLYICTMPKALRRGVA